MSMMRAAAAVLRTFPPETAHGLGLAALRTGLMQPHRRAEDPRLAVRLRRSGLELSNPVGLAAGFDKNAEVFTEMLGFGFGFVECGTVTPLPQSGNPRPRLFRLSRDRAVINRMGFNNEGLEAFAARLEAQPRRQGPVGANVGANKDSVDRINDYVVGVRRVWAISDYVTVNISSPNTPGLRGLQDRGALEELLGRIGEEARALEAASGPRPLFLKVAPDLDDRAIQEIVEVTVAAERLTGLIVSNTTTTRPESLQDPQRSETGGLSGAPLLERSTAVLATFASALDGRLDLIGAGGVSSAQDVVRKLQAGAGAVQLYSALVYEGPDLVSRIKQDLLRLMDAEGVRTLEELIGVSKG